MATVTIYGYSPDVPSPIQLASWQEDLENLYGQGNVTRTSSDDQAVVTYDIVGAPTDAEIQGVVGENMNVTVS